MVEEVFFAEGNSQKLFNQTHLVVFTTTDEGSCELLNVWCFRNVWSESPAVKSLGDSA